MGGRAEKVTAFGLLTGADCDNHKRPQFGEKLMSKRGRRSAAELSVVPLRPEEKKLAPPPTLTAPEALIWTAVVADTPAGWFSAAQEPLLSAYCRHVATGNLLSEWIDEQRPHVLSADALRKFSRLLAMRLRETAAALSVATKLRLTQQAQMHPRTAGRAMATDHNAAKPCDYRGRDQ